MELVEEETQNWSRVLSLRMIILSIFILLVLLVILTMFTRGSKAETYVEGHITSDTTWNAYGSPYVVEGHVYVDDGISLDIEPGVEVMFDGYYTLYVSGNLTAVGDETNYICFTSYSSNPSESDWYGIKPYGAQCFRFEYCNISYAKYGISYFGRHFDYPINNCTFWDNERGLYLSGCENLTISDIYAKHNSEGIYVYGTSNVTLTNCNISNNRDGLVTPFIETVSMR
jgi:hypothetical protein